MVEAWLTGGVVLCLLEVIVPGQVLIGLGSAAILVGGAVWLGLVEGVLSALTLWFIGSMALTVAIRGAVARLMPGDASEDSTDEDADVAGRVVEVVETIEPGRPGRVRFGETSWPAICFDGRLEAGLSARLLMRDGLCWVVAPLRRSRSG